MRRLSDLLLTTEPVQRVRLSQALLAMALMAAGVVAMHYFVWVGVAPQAAVWWWTVLSFAGIVAAFGLIRSGWSRRMPDPSLVLPQMLYAITSGAIAYAIVGAGRGGVFPIVMVILMFGLFAASPRQMRWVSVYAVALFGAVMALATLIGFDAVDMGPLLAARYLEPFAMTWIHLAFRQGYGRQFAFALLRRG